jgi:hypothetical protein
MRGTGRTTPEDRLDLLLDRIEQLERQVSRLKNNMAFTLPVYDPANFPDESVENQLVFGTDHKLWRFQDGVWHVAGGIDYGVENDGTWLHIEADSAKPGTHGTILLYDNGPVDSAQQGISLVSQHNGILLSAPGQPIDIGPNALIVDFENGIVLNQQVSSVSGVGPGYSINLPNSWSKFTIFGVSGTRLFEIRGDNTFHIKSGASWVADL